MKEFSKPSPCGGMCVRLPAIRGGIPTMAIEVGVETCGGLSGCGMPIICCGVAPKGLEAICRTEPWVRLGLWLCWTGLTGVGVRVLSMAWLPPLCVWGIAGDDMLRPRESFDDAILWSLAVDAESIALSIISLRTRNTFSPVVNYLQAPKKRNSITFASSSSISASTFNHLPPMRCQLLPSLELIFSYFLPILHFAPVELSKKNHNKTL